MRKVSVLVSLVFIFFGLYVGYTAYVYNRELVVEYEKLLTRRSGHLVDVMTEVRDQLERSASPESLKQILTRNRERKLIDFYVVRQGREVLASENIDLSSGSMDVLDVTDQLLVYEHLALLNMVLTAPTGPSFAVSVGFNRDWARYRRESIRMLMSSWLQDLVLIPLMVLGLVAFFFRDIFKLIRRFDQREKGDVSTLKVQSSEGEKLKQAILGYEENISDLKGARRVFEKQIYSAVREEIQSGMKPPYRFTCTLVRTDLNNYSGIRKNSDPEKFQAVIDDLFMGLMDIIAHYKGHVTEFLGDELILYFKDADSQSSVALAAACVRDMNEFADRMSVRSKQELGDHLKMKTALCHGTIEVSEATRGYQFQGQSLIESVRILKVIDEKDEHVVLASQDTAQLAPSLMKFSFYKESELKGLGTLKLLRVMDLPSLSERLEGMSSDRCWEVSLYRSENHLIELLGYFQQSKAARQTGFRVQMSLMKEMRDALVRPSNSEQVAQAYRRLLKTAREMSAISADQVHEHWLSAVVALSTNLISDTAFVVVQDDFLDLLANQRGRILANAVEAIHRESVVNGNFQTFELIHHSNNRIVANALVLLGKGEVSSKVVSRLSLMLEDKNPLFVASGLYALGQIASHHKVRDLVYYRTHVGLAELVGRIPKFLNNPNEMIHRQAVAAAKRIGDDLLLEHLRDIEERRRAI